MYNMHLRPLSPISNIFTIHRFAHNSTGTVSNSVFKTSRSLDYKYQKSKLFFQNSPRFGKQVKRNVNIGFFIRRARFASFGL